METPEEKDVNTALEGVEEQQVVSQPDTDTVVTQPDTGAETDKTIPYDRFKEVNEAKKHAEEQLLVEQQARQVAEQQAAQMRQMQVQEQAPVVPDDEYLNAGQVRQLAAQQNNQMQYNMFLSQHPDTHEVVGQVVGGALKPSEHLQKALQANPALYQLQMAAMNGSSDALQLLYMQADAQKQISASQAELATLRQAAAANTEQQTAIAAKTGVTSPLSAGGGGAMTGELPEAGTPEGDAYFERMKRGEFD